MAVFTSFSDESAGKTDRDTFLWAGWIGPEEDWSRFFAPAWDERVLAGPPRIPYLHMTEIRSSKWRESHQLAEADAESRIDQACILIDQLANLQPIRVVIDAGEFRDEFHESKVVPSASKQFRVSEFEPDYICFLAYAWAALTYMSDHHPEAGKLDFVVEQKNKVTKYIQDFHAGLPDALAAIGSPGLAGLVGDLIPGGKECVQLQSADLLCWHCARREKLETMNSRDKLRYKSLAYRKGIRIHISKQMIVQLKSATYSR